MMRFMNSSNLGSVNAVSPWFGLQIIPLVIRSLRAGAKALTFASQQLAMPPERWGLGQAGTGLFMPVERSS